MRFEKVNGPPGNKSLIETVEESLDQPHDAVEMQLREVSSGFIDIDVIAYFQGTEIQRSFSSVRIQDVAGQLVQEQTYALSREGKVRYEIPEVNLPHRSKVKN